jgi:hypothetical protein
MVYVPDVPDVTDLFNTSRNRKKTEFLIYCINNVYPLTSKIISGTRYIWYILTFALHYFQSRNGTKKCYDKIGVVPARHGGKNVHGQSFISEII